MRYCFFLLVMFVVVWIINIVGAAENLTVQLNGQDVLPSNGTVAGVWFFAEKEEGPQMLLLGHPRCGFEQQPKYKIVASLNAGDTITLHLPIAEDAMAEPLQRQWDEGVQITQSDGTMTLSADQSMPEGWPTGKPATVILEQFQQNGKPVSLEPKRRSYTPFEVESSPNMHPFLDMTLLEWDWKMQDGIDTPEEPRTYSQAIEKLFLQGDLLYQDLGSNPDFAAPEFAKRWADLKNRFAVLQANAGNIHETEWELLWLHVHDEKRLLSLSNPLFCKTPILFVKHVPSTMSHQLTQVYGYCARPGGGLFVLDQPGKSMNARPLGAGLLPTGNYMRPEVSYDGNTIYFPFCEVEKTPEVWRDPNSMDRHYHIYSLSKDGTGLKRLTEGPYDDFSPLCLPNGKIAFISTRRGGFHRCGAGPCAVYTLALMNSDGSHPHTISYHETHEWDPAVLSDGRIIYTRWDYVDRDAVFYQQLWSVRPDGTDVRIYYGNNTFNPCGTWEARAVPGSSKIMATAAPHHGMTAGSVILLDTSLGVDGPEPVTRLTPDALFPESEVPLAYGNPLPNPMDFDTPAGSCWDANRPDRPAIRQKKIPEEQKRWAGHVYKSPWPLSENYFLVAYSFDKLLGELGPNIPNQFGLYLMDRFGNKELIYRDPNLSSLWPIPLAARPAPPSQHSVIDVIVELPGEKGTGTFYLQDVYESWPYKIEEKITHLRIVQVLPKTTPNANEPMVGAAFASPGKQVLGTVQVEDDGSAWFEAPAKTPILFQALDSSGRMVQTMRSLTYLQPGENASCIGCHENRMSTALPKRRSLASDRGPEKIQAGPPGSKPFSYPILVQPVLDKHCVSCHNTEKTDGNVNLSGEIDGHYTRSYNALISRVSYTAWSMPEGNHEPMSLPNQFGARASTLVKLLDQGHYDCQLMPDDWERVNTWIDANALFYGTFNPGDQARQQRGEWIDGPDWE